MTSTRSRTKLLLLLLCVALVVAVALVVDSEAQDDFFFDEVPLTAVDQVRCGRVHNQLNYDGLVAPYADVILEDDAGAQHRFVFESCWPWCGRCAEPARLVGELAGAETVCLQQRAIYNPFCTFARRTLRAQQIDARERPAAAR